MIIELCHSGRSALAVIALIFHLASEPWSVVNSQPPCFNSEKGRQRTPLNSMISLARTVHVICGTAPPANDCAAPSTAKKNPRYAVSGLAVSNHPRASWAVFTNTPAPFNAGAK